MSTLLQNILILVGLLCVGGLGYYLYMQNSDSSLDTQNAQVSNQVAIETAEFLRRLNELKAITLDTSVFSDPRFSSLVEMTTTPPVERVGRNNPFEITSE